MRRQSGNRQPAENLASPSRLSADRTAEERAGNAPAVAVVTPEAGGEDRAAAGRARHRARLTSLLLHIGEVGIAAVRAACARRLKLTGAG
jgi:hypothetical protein